MLKISKKIKLVVAIGIALVLIPNLFSYIIFYPRNPFTQTDPYHPGFDPDNFRFENYGGSSCMEKSYFSKLFPIGTDKVFVDRVLVSAGGAKAKKVSPDIGEGSNTYSYYYKATSLFSRAVYRAVWNVAVYYDKNNKLINMKFSGDEADENIYTHLRDCKIGIDYGSNW